MKVTRNRQGSERLRVAVKGLDGTTGKVGFFETAKYPDGTPVAYVAVIQEFGTAKIPARPTMRPTIAEQSSEWSRQFGQGAKAVARGDITATQIMDTMCAAAAGDVRKSIAALTSPPLAEATLARRRSRYADKKTVGNLSKPLVDTAVMVNSVTHAVETGGGT